MYLHQCFFTYGILCKWPSGGTCEVSSVLMVIFYFVCRVRNSEAGHCKVAGRDGVAGLACAPNVATCRDVVHLISIFMALT